MIHVIAEIGKSGKKERERRHFPDMFNQQCNVDPPKVSGRRYIPHQIKGREDEWRPHNQSIDVAYTDSGPDWTSKIKYIPAPENVDYPAAEIWPNNWRAMRPFPFTYRKSEKEWLMCPGLTKLGLKCLFDGVHKATATSDCEVTHSAVYSCRRFEDRINMRNSLAEASPGDKSYQAPEYEPDFFRASFGDTLPKFSTGNSPYMSPRKKRADTFIPLVLLPPVKKETYRQKVEQQRTREEVDEVKRLEIWQPAKPISSAFLNFDQSEFKKY